MSIKLLCKLSLFCSLHCYLIIFGLTSVKKKTSIIFYFFSNYTSKKVDALKEKNPWFQAWVFQASKLIISTPDPVPAAAKKEKRKLFKFLIEPFIS